MSSNGFVGKEAFFQPFKRRFGTVETPIGRVRIRSLNEAERSKYERTAYDAKGNTTAAGVVGLKLQLIVACCCDKDGNQLFSTEDIGKLKEIDAAVVDLLSEECRKICELEGTEKNLQPTGGGDLPTG
jgi:hypothetical protein